MQLTIAFTALILAAMFVGRGGGADGSSLLLPAEESNQDVVFVSLHGRTPVSSTPTPYTEASSVMVTPQNPHSHAESDVEALICAMPWPCAEALSVAFCESRYDSAAYNSSGAKGVFQLMPIHQWRGGDFLDAATNIEVAYAVYADNAGWGSWVCKP